MQSCYHKEMFGLVVFIAGLFYVWVEIIWSIVKDKNT